MRVPKAVLPIFLSLLLLPLMYLVYWYYSFYVSSQTARQQAY